MDNNLILLSKQQQAIWINQQIHPNSSMYNVGGVIDIIGEIDINKLYQAVEKTMNSFDVLEIVEHFLKEEDDLDEDFTRYSLKIIDGTEKFDGQDWIQERIDLKRNLAEIVIYSPDCEETQLFVKWHHLIFDGVSASICINSIFDNYESSVSKPSFSYHSFMEDEKEYFSSEEYIKNKNYWKDKLDSVDVSSKGFSSISKPNQSLKSERKNIIIPRSLFKEIQSYCKETKVTPFHYFIAVIFTLNKVYNAPDFILGLPILNRRKKVFKQTGGMFTDIIPFLNEMDKNQSFDSLVKKISWNLRQDYRHQRFPMSDINQLFDKSISPNVFFSYQKNIYKNAVENATITSNYLPAGEQLEDLGFHLLEYSVEGDLTLAIDYRISSFNLLTIEKLSNHLVTLIKHCKNKSDVPISALSCLSKDEEQQLLVDFNDTKADYSKDKTLIELFETQAERTPDHVAIVFNEVELTYKELNERANQFGDYLRKRYSVQSDDLVAMMLDRSEWMIVSILAVLKSGGAYVPIDPDYTQSRIDYLLADSSAKVLIDQNELDTFIAKKEEFGKTNLKRLTEPHHLAYVIYTSGSTGKPKGVLVENRSIVNTIEAQITTFKLDEHSRGGQYASLAFDASVSEIFSIVLSGGTLVIINEEIRKDTVQLSALIEQNDISFLTLPSFVAKQLDVTVLSGIRTLICAGDVIDVDLFNSNKNVWNCYGPTECSIWTNYYKNKNDLSIGSIPIGRPISNTRIYILDDTENLLPIGVVGEICIAGAGLARGYLNRPDLTAKKFISNPFEEGKRMYKTGDLGRWLPNGNIEFIGRKDDQVKIRGYRIEPGEIEAALIQHMSIQEVVVLAKENESGDKQLVAYLTSDQALNTNELRTHLKNSLPDYMVPAYYVQLEDFPLTPNGKLDKKALPSPEGLSLNSGIAYVAPSTKIEQQLVRVWSEVLKVEAEKIGIHEDFFALGGDSIKSIQISSKMKAKGYRLEVKDILGHSILLDQTLCVATDLLEIPQEIVKGEVPLGAIQHSFLYDDNMDKHHFHQSIGLRSPSSLEPEQLNKVFNKLIEHHDALRMVYNKQKDVWIQYNQPATNKFKVEVHDLSTSNNVAQQITAISNQIKRSFNLNEGPLIKVCLFKTSACDELLITVHHLVIDGVSWRIIFEDIATLLTRITQNQPLQLPLKSHSFKHWLEQIHLYANDDHTKERDYWNNVLSQQASPIPLDHVEGTNALKDLVSAGFSLSKQETTLLLSKVNQAYKTEINDILLTAFVLALKAAFGIQNTAITIEGHGREAIIKDLDTSRTVGWFTSVYPVVFDLSYEDPCAQLIEVKDALRRVPNKGVGYHIFEQLSTHKLKDAIPSQIIFNYLGDFGEGLSKEDGNSLFEFSPNNFGDDVSLNRSSEHHLSVSGMQTAGELTLSILYSNKQFNKETIDRLAAGYENSLKKLITVLSEKQERVKTSGDYVYKALSQQELGELTASYPSIENIASLAPMQQGIYYHWLADKHTAAYVEQISYTIKGEVDRSALEKSYAAVIASYDALRANFTEDLLQVISASGKTDFRYEDVSHIQNQQQWVDNYLKKDKEEGFDLQNGALMRFSLLKLSEDAYQFVWTNHHILTDGWCISILNTELFKRYAHYIKTGKALSLPKPKPFVEYISWLNKKDERISKAYWKDYLEGYTSRNTLNKLRNFSINSEPGFIKKELGFTSSKSVKELKKVCSDLGITINTLIQTVWGIVLSNYSNSNDVVFGAVVSGRPSEIEDVQSMVGLFINTIPVRIQYEHGESVRSLLEKVNSTAIKSLDHHHLPLFEVQSLSDVGNLLIDHLMVFENYPLDGALLNQLKQGNGLGFLLEDIQVSDQTNYDLNITVFEREEIYIRFDYNELVYDEFIIKRVIDRFSNLLSAVSDHPDRSIEDLPFEPLNSVFIVATFTANLLEDPIRLFSTKKVDKLQPVFGDYNQILQLVNNPDSSFYRLHGDNVILIRWEDCYREVEDQQDLSSCKQKITDYTNYLTKGLAANNSILKKKTLVIFDTALSVKNEKLEIFIKENNANFIKEVSALSNIELVSVAEICNEFNLEEVYDLQLNEIAHIPYQQKVFNALGTYISRWDYTSKSDDVKVIVLDCDNTLWKGILGESSHEGIEIDASRVQFHKQLKQLKEQGYVLSICSKNNVEEVEQFFTYLNNRSELLQLSDFVCPKINWSRKSENIRQIAEELNLGLANFMFIDDSDLECSEVRASLPEVVTLQMPQVSSEIEGFIANLWCFNKKDSTNLDHQRTQLYQQESQRKQTLPKFQDYQSFIESLNIKTEFGEVLPKNVSRVAQLTARTNQFNANKVIFSKEEITTINNDKQHRIFSVTVEDKFGAYGIVGVILIKMLPNMLVVENVLLSCRVLGRGVEHKMLQFIGNIALEKKIENIHLKYSPTSRNKPVELFLNEIGARKKDNEFTLTAEQAVNIQIITKKHEQTTPKINTQKDNAISRKRYEEHLLSMASVELNTLEKIGEVSTRFSKQFKVLPSTKMEYVAPNTTIEKQLVKIWSEVLGLEEETIGIHDDFFALGGHSLKATTIVSKIAKELNTKLAIQDVFTHPTIKSISSLIDNTPAFDYQEIPVVATKDSYVISAAQRRMWVLSQFEGTNIAYNMHSVLEIEGELDHAAFETAFDQLITRHESLRTVFKEDENGDLRQWILPEDDHPFKFNHQKVGTNGSSKAMIKSILSKELQYTFNLSEDALLRATLIQKSNKAHVFVFVMHHIISDGWSIDILTRDLLAYYNGLKDNTPVNLPALRIQYKDYSEWQHSILQNEQQAKKHWMEQFSGELPVLNLPLDYARPAIQTFNGGVVTALLNKQITNQLNTITQETGATLFMSLLASVKVLLYKYTGQTDIILGSPIAGREDTDLTNQIGFYVNTLALRTSMSSEASFKELLVSIKENTLQAYAYQNYPFDELVNDLNLQRDLSRNPLFDVMVALHNNKQPDALGRFSGLSMRAYENQEATIVSQFDLTFDFTEINDQIALEIKYNTALFTQETIERLSHHLNQLIQSITKKPDAPISKLGYLNKEEVHQLLFDFNNTLVDYAKEQTIVTLFEEQVEKNPNGTAVVFEEETLTYKELNERVNQLSHYLIATHNPENNLIGICLSRSNNMLIAMLAVLKSGSAYIPIDPKYPLSRINYIAKDAKVEVVITESEILNFIPFKEIQTLVCLDKTIMDEDVSPKTDLDLSISSNTTAYVIYTSGSTGNPKGVKVSHGNLSNFICGMNDCIDINSKSTWLSTTSISFDISILELLYPLSLGNKIAIKQENPLAEQKVRDMDFSLFYFAASEAAEHTNKYELLIEGAKFADKNGMKGLWVPERHFHSFGDQFPNPAISASAISTITGHIKIRSGSIVLPLHNPIRVAEDWSMVDNLSDGRVELSIASGWHPNDFVFYPENYADRFNVMRQNLGEINRLWTGNSLVKKNGVGENFEFKLHPKPIQKELPIWVTAAGNPATFKYAGSIGANILTHLLGQDKKELKEKIKIYRTALAENGFDPAKGKVALMLHTFVTDSERKTKQIVTAPFRNYLRHSIGLMAPLAKSLNLDLEKNLEQIIDTAFNRYYQSASLFGTVDSCYAKAQAYAKIGVNEIACLVDFGIDNQVTLAELNNVVELQQKIKLAFNKQDYFSKITKGASSFSDLIVKENITHFQATPSYFSSLLDNPKDEKVLKSLRSILVGGEKFPEQLLDKLKAYDCNLYNMYGPTETTIWSSVKNIKPNESKITIGKPIANTQIYILDNHQNLLPAGIVGEIYIAGDGLTKGYLDRPELTAEKFVSNPFVKDSRMYKTGDLGKWLPDGDIEIIGRIDHQIKIRGHRVELSAIEAKLNDFESVSESVVLLKGNDSSDKELVAYIRSEEEIRKEDLRTYLKGILPGYMVPYHYVHLKEFPLTPNGKLDKNAFPGINGSELNKNAKYTAPNTKIEKELVGIWADILGVEASQIGVHDDFFDLGGNSLKAMLFINKISKTFNLSLKIEWVFSENTISNLSQLIELLQEEQRSQYKKNEKLKNTITF